jgi:hypothetical protein
MKRVLILILVMTTLAAARNKKPKFPPGPYIFTSKASAQTLKGLIVEENLRRGYTLDSDEQLQFRFSQATQMPLMEATFTASSDCTGMTTKKVWSYTLVERNGMTRVTVQPFWEYPDDYCHMQTQDLIWSLPEEMAAFQAMLDTAPTSTAQVRTPSPAPASPAVAPVPTPAPVGQPQKAEPAKQNVAQPTSQEESSGDAALRAKQHAACLELAKDNPSIICK